MLEIDVTNSFMRKIKRKDFLCRKLVRFSPAEIDLILLSNMTHELISYEFKLNNPRKALLQAIRNKIYCHYSYIVLPHEEALKLSDEILKENGIGLICYSRKGRGFSFQEVFKPSKSEEVNRKLKRIVYSKFYDSIIWSSL